MRAFIRKVEHRTIEVTGAGLPEIAAELEKLRPAGFDLVSSPVTMKAGSTDLSAVGTYARRDEVRELHGASRAELLEQVPEGWQMLYTLAE